MIFRRLLTKCYFIAILQVSIVAAILLRSPLFADTVADDTDTQLHQGLIELASQGQLSEPLLKQFFLYAEHRAKQTGKGSSDFWNWITRQDGIRQGLLAGLHPGYDPNVIVCFDQLYSAHASEIDQFADLALAFAFVYGAAGDQSIRAPWMTWTARDRDVPSSAESFDYYLRNNDRMLYPLDKLPWPLLLYIADNDTPISERQWVLSHYKGRQLQTLKKIHDDPKYIPDAKINEILDNPAYSMALPRIRADGGVCSQQAYYASCVFKSLGVPSVRLLQTKHAYEAWLANASKMIVEYGKPMGRKDGYFLCPLTRTKKRQYEFAMLASAMENSCDKYVTALTTSHIFNTLPENLKPASLDLLNKGLQYNRYCTEIWLTLAKLYESETISAEEGWENYKKARTLIPQYPEVACVLLDALSARWMRTGLLDSEDTRSENITRLKAAAKWLDSIDRADLADKQRETLRLYAPITKGDFGAVDSHVTTVTTLQTGCYVFRVIPHIPPSSLLTVSVKHAAAGAEGAFHIVAWTDTDNDGIPDDQISMSPLLTSGQKDQWSQWQFTPTQKTIFVGIAQEEDIKLYYDSRDTIEPYPGLSNCLYYTRKFTAQPKTTAQPRYTNIRINL